MASKSSIFAIYKKCPDIRAQAVIPPRDNRPQARHYDRHLYKDRNLVERFFNRIKHLRRIATRYDKLDRSYLAFLSLVCTFVWLL